MEWTQVFALIGGNLALILPLWLWNRAESRADMRAMDTKLENLRASTEAQINSIKEATVSITTAIRDDMREFHGKLERQDAEFKGKMEKQDAEFKAHLMYGHRKD